MAENPNRKPPPEPIEHAHDMGRLHIVFAVAAVILVGTTIYSVLDDFNRPWKKFQREYIRRDRERVAVERAEAEKDIDPNQLNAITAELTKAQEHVHANAAALKQTEARLTKLRTEQYKVDQDYKFAKAELDTLKWNLEQAKSTGKGLEKAQKKFDDLTGQWREHGKRLEEINAKIAADEKERDSYEGQVEVVEKKRDALRERVTTLEKRGEQLREDLDFVALNKIPLLDFVNPTIKVQQVVLDDLLIDINFMRIPRVDRCQTCHTAIDRKGWEKEPQPFTTHPRLDLFVGSNSKHPMATYGCTVCHKGRDRALEFGRAGHEPESPAEHEAWVEKYDYHPDHFNEEPMLPAKFSAAGCWQCHKSNVRTNAAPQLDKGISLVEQLGCWGCHEIKGLEGMRKVGPELKRVSSKLSQPWVYWWLQDPKSFRPATKMPRFFHLSNMNTPYDHARNDTEVAAITAFLMGSSEPAVPLPAAPGGDPVRGKEIFETVGCQGCHMIEANAAPDFSETHRQHGPNLSGIGSKTSPAWIYSWVKDPQRWWPETNMPDLRLTEAEAADVTAFLMTQRNPQFEALMTKPQPSDAAALEELALWSLSSSMTPSAAKAAYAAMPPPERLNFVGKNLVSRYGCFGCHDIAGFEDAKPIGTELTNEGSKSTHLLDYGFVKIPHTREAFFHQKIADPRIFDKDKVKDYDEKLKMPLFNLTEKGNDQVTTALLGFVRDSLRPGRAAAADPAITAGRRLVQQKNCQGCHRIELHGGDIRTTLPDPTLAPPYIENQGERVQTDWMAAFLRDPSRVKIRPWLSVRMPTFHFNGTQLNTVLRYFVALDKATFPYTDDYRVQAGRSVNTGRIIFKTLRCGQCHPSTFVPGQAKPSELAPNLGLAAGRLRADWVPHWIREPEVRIPGTRMPTNFPVDPATGQRTSPLAGIFDAPFFAADRADLVAQFGGDEQAARAFLSDIDGLTNALRDYIWSISGGTGAATTAEPISAAPAPQLRLAP